MIEYFVANLLLIGFLAIARLSMSLKLNCLSVREFGQLIEDIKTRHPKWSNRKIAILLGIRENKVEKIYNAYISIENRKKELIKLRDLFKGNKRCGNLKN